MANDEMNICLTYISPRLWIDLAVGLPSKFRSEKIPRNRLGAVFVVPRKKVLLSRNSVCLGIAHTKVRNGTEWNSVKKCFYSHPCVFCPWMVRNEFPKVFSFASWFRTKFWVFFSSAQWFGKEFRSFLSNVECFGTKISQFFSLLWNGLEWNSELFYLPRNG